MAEAAAAAALVAASNRVTGLADMVKALPELWVRVWVCTSFLQLYSFVSMSFCSLLCYAPLKSNGGTLIDTTIAANMWCECVYNEQQQKPIYKMWNKKNVRMKKKNIDINKI